MKEGQPAAAAISSSTNGLLTGSLMGATSNASPSLNGPLPLSSSGSTTVLSAAGGIVNSASYNSLPGLYKGGNNSAYNTGDQQPFLSSPGKGLLASKSDLWDSASFPARNLIAHDRDDEKQHPSATENVPLAYQPKRPNEISDLLADPLGQTVSGKRGQEGLKIKINRKNNAGRNQADTQANQAAKPKASRKNSKTNGASTADVSMTSTDSAVTPNAADNKDDSPTGAKKSRKRNSERKEKGAPRGRGKAAQALNGDNDKSASQERPTKKSKLDAAYRREQTATSSAVNAETMIEPEYLAPLEAGSNIFLEGIVWHETSGGILVVNVTWRGKSYVGTLLDSTKHDCAPPATRICDSPPSDIDVTNRSPTKERSQKRGRGGTAVLSEGEVHAPLALRCGKRRGANFQTPASPARSDTASGTKNGRRGRGSTSSARSQRASEETVPELPSPTEEAKPKRGRRPTSGPTTPTSAGVPETVPIFPKSTSEPVACTVRNCEKKFGNADGLRFHLQAQHGLQSLPSFDEEKSTDSQSDTKEDLNSSTDSIASPIATTNPALSVPASPSISEAPHSKVEILPTPTHHFPAARPEDLIVPGTHSRVAEMEESVSAEEESKRSKQRRKQPNPVSSQHKKGGEPGLGDSSSKGTSNELSSTKPEGSYEPSPPATTVPATGEKSLSFEPSVKPLIPQDLSKTAKDATTAKTESSFRAMPRSLDSSVPLDLKIPSSLSNRVSSVDQYTTSPLADSLKMATAPSEGRTSPAYSDISDDETDESKNDPPKDVPVVDKPGYGFQFLGPVAPFGLMGPMVDVDRKGSPADQVKSMIPMAGFPGFIYPVASGRSSETFSPTFGNLSQSPQPRLGESHDSKASSSPSPLYSSKSSSRSKDVDKSDGKGRSPLARDSSVKNEVKSEPGRTKEESSRKSTPENDAKPLTNGSDRPQAYPAPPAYMMNGAYRNNAAQSFPVPMAYMNGQRGPPMFGPTAEQLMSMFYNGHPPVGLPPGLPQGLPSQEPTAMDMMQQRLYPTPPAQGPHKIHELKESGKASGSSPSSEKKPSASPVPRKSESSSTKSFPSSSESHRQRNGQSMLNGSPLPSQMIGSPPVDPFNLFPGQYPPPISLPQ